MADTFGLVMDFQHLCVVFQPPFFLLRSYFIAATFPQIDPLIRYLSSASLATIQVENEDCIEGTLRTLQLFVPYLSAWVTGCTGFDLQVQSELPPTVGIAEGGLATGPR